MKFGLNVSNLGSYWDVRNIVAIAKDAEQAGWDGVFVWDQMVGQQAWGNPPMCDPWIALGAVALATERVRIGPMITPIARRRPWKVARESVTVDRLSAGRMTLGVGLGNPPDDFAMFGEDANNHVRARKLDEGLDVLLGVWSGEEFSYDGRVFSPKQGSIATASCAAASHPRLGSGPMAQPTRVAAVGAVRRRVPREERRVRRALPRRAGPGHG
jgi:alkanesulfonate monooxygenase SsuD/methylene tetrahydromethanopterin reductase-like flavin-dependent oxidoreductase (luciferase family)